MGLAPRKIAGDNPIPPEVTDDTGEDSDDDLTPSAERVDASRVVRLWTRAPGARREFTDPIDREVG